VSSGGPLAYEASSTALPLEDARAYAAYGMISRVGKILEIRNEEGRGAAA
jgi:hypothetical protein